jgi:hypothetical protein
MIHFKLKRRLSGKKLRKLKRLASNSQEIVTPNEIWGHKFSYKPLPHKKYTYNHNRPVGKEYGPTIYQLEDQHSNQTGVHKKFKRNIVNNGDWFAFKILSTAKNQTQKERVYKLYPKHDPKYSRELEHEKKIKNWKDKLHKNHLNQISCQSSK